MYKGTLETALSWMWKGKHKQAGRNMLGTQPSRAVASHGRQGWILPPWHNCVIPFVAAVSVL